MNDLLEHPEFFSESLSRVKNFVQLVQDSLVLRDAYFETAFVQPINKITNFTEKDMELIKNGMDYIDGMIKANEIKSTTVIKARQQIKDDLLKLGFGL